MKTAVAGRETVACELASNPNVFLRTKVQEELGLSPDAGGAALGDAVIVGSLSAGVGVAIGHIVTTVAG